jgi:hypothetical protein
MVVSFRPTLMLHNEFPSGEYDAQNIKLTL